MDSVLALVFPGGKRLQNTIAATAGTVITNLSPATDKRWLILRGEITLDTDGNAANRFLNLDVTDGTNIVEKIGRSDAIILNKVAIVTFGEFTASLGSDAWVFGRTASGDSKYYLATRGIIIEGADQFRITIAGGLAGDSYSGRVVVLEI